MTATCLGLVFDLHIGGGEQLGIDSLGQSHKDVFPRSPDAHSQCERSTDGEDGVPDDIPQEGVQEEQT